LNTIARNQRIDIELEAQSGAQGTSKGAVEAQILPQLMQRKDVAKGPRRLMGDLDLVGLLAPGRTAQSPDQSIELAAILVVEAPEIYHDTVPWLACLVAAGLDDPQGAPPPALVDAHEHACRIVSKTHLKEIQMAPSV